MKVVIIGSGNVATVLGKKMKATGIEILEVVSPNRITGVELSKELSSSYNSNILKINSKGDIYIIAVSDKVVASVAKDLKLNNKLVVHTAGGLSINILKEKGIENCNYGVMYPLQSLNKSNQNIPVVPILVDGNTKDTIECLTNFASQWADTTHVANDDERLKMHVAAVFSSNFANYMYSLAADLCTSEALNFSILRPLIEETSLRLRNNNPSDVQTGPAVRKDMNTISHHLAILEKYPELHEVYQMLSLKIIDHFDIEHKPSVVSF